MIYTNITFNCNNNCVFCAADKNYIRKENISFESIKHEIDRATIGEELIINGGEPTISKDLLQILNHASKRMRITLFTNGRRLNDIQFCQNLLTNNINKICIPIFGNNAYDHDILTQTPNSFNQTVNGIHNLLDLRDNTIVELKLLFMKPTLKTNPKIAEWMDNNFEDIYITLNPLIVSQQVYNLRDYLIPSFEELKISVNKTLEMKYSNKTKVINAMPNCLLSERNKKFVIVYKPNNKVSYIDSHYYITGNNNKRIIPNRCKLCIYPCRFIFGRYDFNDSICRESIRAIFPGGHS